MNIAFQRAVDRMVGVPVCRLLSAWERLRGQRGPVFPPRRILVILLSEMGSLALAQPMFVRLKESYPEASLYVMLFAKNREMLDLLYVVPKDNVITLSDRSLKALAGDSIKALRGFFSRPFDVVIDCELFARISSIFAYLSGAPVRVGFHPHTQEGLYRGSFINRPVLYNPYLHMTEQFLNMVTALESATVPKAKYSVRTAPSTLPMLRFPEDELRQIGRQMFDDFPDLKGKRLILVYASGGILPIRAWPLESFFQLCRTLLAEGYAVGIIGLPDDKSYGEAIKAHCQSEYCADLTGYTRSVRHLLGVFHFADLLISNDGGPGQFAALTPIASIIFFGPETPILYRTLTQNSYCFYMQLPCSPCLTAYNHRNSPCDGDNQCLKKVTPEQVLVKAREMLAHKVRAYECQSPS
jgi:ADP-heptose:LPS heptosyltransferase